jgi:hypothetical protein
MTAALSIIDATSAPIATLSLLVPCSHRRGTVKIRNLPPWLARSFTERPDEVLRLIITHCNRLRLQHERPLIQGHWSHYHCSPIRAAEEIITATYRLTRDRAGIQRLERSWQA